MKNTYIIKMQIKTAVNWRWDHQNSSIATQQFKSKLTEDDEEITSIPIWVDLFQSKAGSRIQKELSV